MSVIIVIPTYNERDNLDPLLEKVLGELPGARVLIVDDASPDGTGDVADVWTRNYPDCVSVLHCPEKKGLGAAYVAGYAHALEHWPDTEFLIQMDADLSHDPACLPGILEAARDADVVTGSRYVRGVHIVNWPLHRLVLSRLGTLYARIMTGLPITDCTSGFKCCRSQVLRAVDLSRIRSNGYCFQIETSFRAWEAGFRLKDFSITFYKRERGQSKMIPGIAFEAIWEVTRLGLERVLKRKGSRRSS